MKTRFRYEPPHLVDMRAPELCGEFANCASGSNRTLGSCAEYMRCANGTYAERCTSGTSACGCDACCGTGTGYTSTGGYPWYSGCMCNNGDQAGMSCNLYGGITALMCISGGTAGSATCSTGTSVYSSFENCGNGA